MRYLGGKTRTAKPISQLIKDVAKHHNKTVYWEPFLGGGSIAQAVAADSHFKAHYASDAHEGLISLWQDLQRGAIDLPSEVSEAEYRAAVNLPDSDPLKAFIGFGCSYGGVYGFNHYARGEDRNYASEAKNSLEKAAKKLKDFSIFDCDFTGRAELGLSLGSALSRGEAVIYCDIPYQGVTQYAGVASFDRQAFLDRCVTLAGWGNKILVSEYQLEHPNFTEILTIPSKQDLQGRSGKALTNERIYLCTL